MAAYRSKTFDYSKNYRNLNLRRHPELYKVGRGEQGVLLVEPYKSEILPHWRFKNPEIARKSVAAIKKLFERYKKKRDFVGMDMARKFLQMGFTRARRYANHRSGRKYSESGEILSMGSDPVKAKAALLFFRAWQEADKDADYQALKNAHKRLHG